MARSSSPTAGIEQAREEYEKVDKPLEIETDVERAVKFHTTGFSRLRFEWGREDAQKMQEILAEIDKKIMHYFRDVFLLQAEIFEIVRDVETDANGVEIRDRYGFPKWKRKPNGVYSEDYSRLSYRLREHFFMKTTNMLFDLEQRAADCWAEAMMAKARFEETFAFEYNSPRSGTIEDRRAAANLGASTARYFAIYMTSISRKADAIVRNTTLLNQRLKDSLTSST